VSAIGKLADTLDRKSAELEVAQVGKVLDDLRTTVVSVRSAVESLEATIRKRGDRHGGARSKRERTSLGPATGGSAEHAGGARKCRAADRPHGVQLPSAAEELGQTIGTIRTAFRVFIGVAGLAGVCMVVLAGAADADAVTRWGTVL